MGVTARSDRRGPGRAAPERAPSRSALRGANTLSTIVAIAVTEGQRLPRIGADRRGALVRAGGTPEGGGGGVDRDAARAGERVEHRREVVARARADIDDAATAARDRGRPPTAASRASSARAAVSGRKWPARRNASRASTISGVSALPGTRFT